MNRGMDYTKGLPLINNDGTYSVPSDGEQGADNSGQSWLTYQVDNTHVAPRPCTNDLTLHPYMPLSPPLAFLTSTYLYQVGNTNLDSGTTYGDKGARTSTETVDDAVLGNHEYKQSNVGLPGGPYGGASYDGDARNFKHSQVR